MVTVLLPLVLAACAPPDLEHRLWTAFVTRYVSDGLVDYAAVKARGRPDLERYLESLDAICPESFAALRPNDRLALFLNAYNAHVIRLVANAYPVKSIRDLHEPFAERTVVLRAARAEPFSLDVLENELIRASFPEPRVHFALVCAAKSCPPLRKTAFVGRELDAQLEEQTRLFLRDPTKNHFDAARHQLELSAIFAWFKADFERGGTVQGFVAKRLGDAVAKPDVVVRIRDYDWTLNEIHH